MNSTNPSEARALEKFTWLEAGLAFLGAFLLWIWARKHGAAAISDDDFARVVIAQRFAQDPRLDPSGTSWLPVPFYLDGLWMMARGATLEAAREATGLRSSLSALLVFAGMRRFGVRVFPAALASALPFVWPTLRILTVATVPEYFTASLTLFAVLTWLGPHGARRGGAAPLAILALFLATLSRYEVWAIALALGASALFRPRQSWLMAVGSLCGPALWCLHGAIHHHSPLFFVARVANYKAALHSTTAEPTEPWASALFAYPRALFELEPLLMALGLAAAVGWGMSRAHLKTWRAVAAVLGFQVLALSLANLGDAAPTHHPERALLVVWLAVPLAPALLCTEIGARGSARSLGRTLPWTALPWTALPWTALPWTALALSLGLYFQLRRPTTNYLNRDVEVAIGDDLRRAQGSHPEATVVATTDYGYFAIEAAAGHPSRFHVAQDHDPRRTGDSVSLGQATRSALHESGARWLVLPTCLDFIAEELAPGSRIYVETQDYWILGPR
jgi:hypothetical protein